METTQPLKKEIKIGDEGYVNQNCWLAKNLGYPPSRHCRYCESNFSSCLFFRYLIMSLILVSGLLIAALIIEGQITRLFIVSIFVLVITYGYYFDKSTQKIIEASFAEKKSKQELEKLTKNLAGEIEERTRELKDAYLKLKKLDETKDDFLLTVQHQLRTPLTGIKWLVETLKRNTLGRLSKRQKEYVEDIHEMNERMIKLVLDMLNVLRLESDATALKKETFTLFDFCGGFISQMLAAAKGKGVELNTSCKNKIAIEVETDSLALRTILENLTSNAINYSASGQEVVLDAIEEGNNVIFSVKDDGIGIPEDEKKRIFERFYRASNAKTYKPDGTGLGLYIASMFADKIGGKIYLESEVGKGSTFYLSIPKKYNKTI